MFSACGGLRTGKSLPVLTAYFPVLAYGILGKGGLFVAPPLEDYFTGLTGTGCTELQLIGSSVADCQALTCPVYSLLNCNVNGKLCLLCNFRYNWKGNQIKLDTPTVMYAHLNTSLQSYVLRAHPSTTWAMRSDLRNTIRYDSIHSLKASSFGIWVSPRRKLCKNKRKKSIIGFYWKTTQTISVPTLYLYFCFHFVKCIFGDF